MSKSFKKNITVTSDEYQIILDSLEMMDSKISAKLSKTVDNKKFRKLKEIQNTIHELLIDLADDDSNNVALIG